AAGKIGNTAIIEVDAHIGDIRGIGHHANAAGGNIFYITVYNAEDNINIVDHPIQDHAYLSTTGVKLRQPVHFNKHRVERGILDCEKCRVKSFYMTYLEFDA